MPLSLHVYGISSTHRRQSICRCFVAYRRRSRTNPSSLRAEGLVDYIRRSRPASSSVVPASRSYLPRNLTRLIESLSLSLAPSCSVCSFNQMDAYAPVVHLLCIVPTFVVHSYRRCGVIDARQQFLMATVLTGTCLYTQAIEAHLASSKLHTSTERSSFQRTVISGDSTRRLRPALQTTGNHYHNRRSSEVMVIHSLVNRNSRSCQSKEGGSDGTSPLQDFRRNSS